MAKVGWGTPILQTAPVIDSAAGTLGAFVTLPVPVQDSTVLSTEKGNKLEAPLEGGGLADVRYDRNKYTLEVEFYKTKGSKKPIADDDGIVASEYAIRLIPEDPSNDGFIMRRASVSVEDTWAANIGHKWKYTFEALRPAGGKILEPYVPMVVTPSSLTFTNAADPTGQTIDVTSESATVTAVSDAAWLTATVSGRTVTATVDANATGVARMANITVTAGEYRITVVVTQEG